MEKQKKKIIINYTQHWNDEGTHYDQVIKIDKKTIKKINSKIYYYWRAPEHIKRKIEKSIGFSDYYNFYFKTIKTAKNYYFLNLTQLKLLYSYLKHNDYDVSRIKARNTLLQFI